MDDWDEGLRDGWPEGRNGEDGNCLIGVATGKKLKVGFCFKEKAY